MPKRSCLVYLLLASPLAVVTGIMAHRLLGFPWDLGAALCSVLITLAGIAEMDKGWQRLRRLQPALAAGQAVATAREGQRVKVAGTLHGTSNASLTAPISGRRCLIYDYRAWDFAGGRQRYWLRGVAMVPCEVRAAAGRFPLLGYPLMDQPESRAGPEDRQRLAAWAAAAAPELVGGGVTSWRDLLSEARELLQPTTSLKKDWSEVGGLGDADLGSLELGEQVVAEGDDVVLSGFYVPATRAIGPSPTLAEPLRLSKSTLRAATSFERFAGWRDIVFGALALPLFHGALWGLLLLLSRRS